MSIFDWLRCKHCWHPSDEQVHDPNHGPWADGTRVPANVCCWCKDRVPREFPKNNGVGAK